MFAGGDGVRQLFISYARENKRDVEALVRDLDALGYQTWVDSSLRGGQTWWKRFFGASPSVMCSWLSSRATR